MSQNMFFMTNGFHENLYFKFILNFDLLIFYLVTSLLDVPENSLNLLKLLICICMVFAEVPKLLCTRV